MDGLNCREITLKEAFANKDKRIDSQFWTTHIFKNPRYTYSKIGKAILSSQYGMSIDMNTEKKGYPIFRMNELHHMMTDLEVEKYAEPDSPGEPGMQPRDPCLPWRGKLGPGHTLR